VLVLLALVACQTVPLTNRSQPLLIPEGTEVQMGLTSYQEILKQGACRRIRRSTRRCAAHRRGDGTNRLPPSAGRARPVGAHGILQGRPAARIPLDPPATPDPDRPDRGLGARSHAAPPAPL